MHFFSFKPRRIFTTSSSQEEILNTVRSMLSSKSKILFFTSRHYFGNVEGQKFAFTTYSGFENRFFVPMVKGQVTSESPTIVHLNFQLPILPAFFLLVFPLIFLPSFFTLDEMTINGVLREPTMNERIGWALFFIGIPAFLYYVNFVRPLQNLHYVLKNKLSLEEKPR
jgi:hypothetical protein